MVRDATQAPDGAASNDLIHHAARSTSEPNRIELANAIFEYLKIFHNRQRRPTALGMRTPIKYNRIHHDNNLAAAPLIK